MEKIFEITYDKRKSYQTLAPYALMSQDAVPLIITLTKFDVLVTTFMMDMLRDDPSAGNKDDDELWTDSRVRATHELNGILKNVPHNSLLWQRLTTAVSSESLRIPILTLVHLIFSKPEVRGHYPDVD